MARWPFVLVFLSTVSQPAFAGPLRVGIALALERGETSGVSGWLRLEVPLERVAAPRAFSERPADVKGEDAAAIEPRAEPPPAAAEPPHAQRARERIPLRHDTAFARAVVREALRLQGHASARERLEGLATRSRVSAILPELMLRAARSTDQSLRLTPSGAERYDFTQTGGADLLFEARATWNLDRLVFADDELRVEHLRYTRQQAAEDLVMVILKHLFAWHRAEARLAAGDLDAEAALLLELEAFEAQAALDALTDGFFGRRLAQGSAATKQNAALPRALPRVEPFAPGPRPE